MDESKHEIQELKKRKGPNFIQILIMLDMAAIIFVLAEGKNITKWMMSEYGKPKQKQEVPATDDMKKIFEKEIRELKFHRILNRNSPFPEIVFRRGPERNPPMQNAKGIKIV